MRPAPVGLLLVCLAGPVLAQDHGARASDELERELRQMVTLPPAAVEIVFEGIDSTRYKLLEARFALDDRPLAFPAASKVLFAGEVAPGKHTLSTTLVYEAPAPGHGSIKYRVPGKFILTAQRGVLMRVRTRIEVDDGAEPSKRLQLKGEAETDLRAKLEEALPPPRPERPPPETGDAGDRLAEAPPGVRAPEEAPRAQLAAVPAPKAQGQPAARKRDAARSTPATAAVESQPAAPPAEQARSAPARPAEADRTADAGATASAVELHAPDAPPSPPPVAPPTPAAEPEAATGLGGMLRGSGAAIIGAVLVLIGLLVFVAARKRR